MRLEAPFTDRVLAKTAPDADHPAAEKAECPSCWIDDRGFGYDLVPF